LKIINTIGALPQKVFADKIYCNKENRAKLKELKIILVAKPLGRPSAKAVDNHIRPGQRNPIEGKFVQAKTTYGMN
jgi:transposase, IS5 family